MSRNLSNRLHVMQTSSDHQDKTGVSLLYFSTGETTFVLERDNTTSDWFLQDLFKNTHSPDDLKWNVGDNVYLMLFVGKVLHFDLLIRSHPSSLPKIHQSSDL